MNWNLHYSEMMQMFFHTAILYYPNKGTYIFEVIKLMAVCKRDIYKICKTNL